MSYFVWWSDQEYEHDQLTVCDTEAMVVTLLNAHAKSEHLQFVVVEGRRVEFKPIEVATRYVRDKGR